jgi:hypothetical protein
MSIFESPVVAPVADVALTRGRREAHVLDRVEAFLSRFVCYPSEATKVASVLWAAHAHALDSFEHTPRLAYLSPEPGSGKTRALEILELITPNPLHAVNATPAYIFRKIADVENRPTILFDEADTVFGPRSAKDHEELRGVLNAGHARGAVAGRCVVRGKTVETEELPAYAAVALAGLGDLPDTVMTRCVVVRMRRRAPHDLIEPYRRRQHGDEGEMLREALAEWVREVADDLTDAWPDLPDVISDRAADVWEPLLAMADAAGGQWPQRARLAAVALVAQAAERPATLGVRLLGDLRDIFKRRGLDQLPTDTILDDLHNIDESPWADLRGRQLDSRGLSRRLREYVRVDGTAIKPVVIRVGDTTPRGYRRDDLLDAWNRYLPLPAPGSATSATAQQAAPEEEMSAPVPAEVGPCVTCGTSTRRYGRAGSPRCDPCQAVAATRLPRRRRLYADAAREAAS